LVEENRKLLKTIEKKFPEDILITITDDFITDCSVDGKPFKVEITVKYKPLNKLLEFESFREYLWSLSYGIVEEYAVAVFNTLLELLEPKYLYVKISGKTQKHGKVVVEIGEIYEQ